MKHLKYIPTVLLFLSTTSFAAPEFFCWTVQGLPPVQTAQYSVTQCDDNVKRVGTLDKQATNREIMCMYNVACEALTDEFVAYLSREGGKEFGELKDSEIEKIVNGKFGNLSVLTCKGKSEKIVGKDIASCPEPNECKNELHYQMGLGDNRPPKATEFKTNFGTGGGVQ